MVRNVNKPYHIVIFLYVITFLCTQVLAIIENGTYCRKMVTKVCCSVSGYKLDHLAINSTTAMAGKAGSTLASAATTVVEFMAKWLNLYPRTVSLILWNVSNLYGFHSLVAARETWRPDVQSLKETGYRQSTLQQYSQTHEIEVQCWGFYWGKVLSRDHSQENRAIS